MRRLAAILTLILGFTLLAATPASAVASLQVENRASGSASDLTKLVSNEARLSAEAVRENIALGYDIASDDAVAARRTGAIPNVGVDGQPRPTHVTTDAPVTSSAAAQTRYELPAPPTHAATVPRTRVQDLGSTPDGRATTSGGGSQNATNQPIPVMPCEIRELCK